MPECGIGNENMSEKGMKVMLSKDKLSRFKSIELDF